MSAVVICAVGFANGSPCPFVGRYVAAFDADAHDGRGLVDYTPHVSKAKRFAHHVEAWEFWRTQSKVRPLRPDGKPNRPLTATTVEMVRVP